ncbi:MAG: rhomboid family intramembrane serine protease [Cyanobacteriota bacterium]
MDPVVVPSPARFSSAFLLPLALLVLAWAQELVDQLIFRGQWNLPMVRGGPISGVLTAPFSHGGLGHLLANSLVFVPLSWLVLSRSHRAYLAVWIGVLVTALPVWWLWPAGSHGLSGVTYGLLGYLMVIGWLERRPLPIVLSLLAMVGYGGLLPGLLPLFTPAGVSWISHAAGFAGGVLAALVSRSPRP